MNLFKTTEENRKKILLTLTLRVFVFVFILSWTFSEFAFFFSPPNIVEAALPGVAHNFRWGLDDPTSSDILKRPTVSEVDDTLVSIKVGAPTGSDSDPVLRLVNVTSDAWPSGTLVRLAYTDCTGVALKTCAQRSTVEASPGTPATNWVYVDDRGLTTSGLFRFRQMAYDTGDTLDGTQITSVLTSGHNPTPAAYISSDSVTTSFTSGAWPESDFSLEYYGTAPSVLKTYIFAQVINGSLVGFSGMHNTTGAVLEVIPANWTGTAGFSSGVSLTSSTTATVKYIFTDDSDQDSTTDFSYATSTRAPTSWSTVCSSVGSGYNAHTFKDTTTGHVRTCDITGLEESTAYYFQIDHTDPDGLAGPAPLITGPYYTDQGKGVVTFAHTTFDASDTTGDDVTVLTIDDVPLGINPVKTMSLDDFQVTVDSGGDILQIDTFSTSTLPASATIDKSWIEFEYGGTGSKTYTHNLNIGAAGTEPAACSAGGSPGTNWTSAWSISSVVSNVWVGATTSAFTGYTINQLGSMDVCLNNSSSGGSAHDLGFDYLWMATTYTPDSSTVTAVTDSPTEEGPTSAQMNGSVDTSGVSGKYYFEYGDTASYGNTTAETYVCDFIGEQEVYETVIDLSPGTLQHYRVCLKAPPWGSGTCGSDNTFTTTAGAATLDQAAYRWFVNTDSTSVGGSAIMNSPMIAPSQGNPFRLRLMLHAGVAQLDLSGTTSILQFAEKSGQCDAGFIGESWTNMSSTSGAIRYYDNSTPTDGAALTANYKDPKHASSTDTGIGTDIVNNQIYSEGENNFINSQSAIPAGEDGLWDFSLVDFSASPGTSYCIRAVQEGEGVLDSYSVVPEITTAQRIKVRLRSAIRLRAVRLR